MKLDAGNDMWQEGRCRVPNCIHVSFWGEKRSIPLGGIFVVLNGIAALLVEPLKSFQADSK